MSHYYYWLFLLVAAPWTPWFYRRRVETTRVSFPALRLLKGRRSYKSRPFQRVILATSRSCALAAFLALALGAFDATWTKERKTQDLLPKLPSRVLIVDGADSGPERRTRAIDAPSVGDYLFCALDVDSERVSSADFALEPSEFLRDYDAIILADLSSPTDAELTKLARFAEREGRFVLIWQGARAAPERWNDALRELSVDAETIEYDGLAQKRLKSFRKSPFSERFPDASLARIDALPVDRLTTLRGPGAVPLLWDSSTDEIVFARIKNGWYWFAASPDPNDGSLAVAPFFTTLVEKTLEFPSIDRVGSFEEREPFSWRPWLWGALIVALAVELAFGAERVGALDLSKRR